MNVYKAIFLFLLIGLVSCQTELSISETAILLQKDFQIDIITYGGLVGESKISYDFNTESDSVKLHITHSFMIPKEEYQIKISKPIFQEVKEKIICLSNLNIESEPINRGCQPPYESEYIITSGLSKINIYPRLQDTCNFIDLIPEYGSLIRLISPEG